MWNRKQLKKNAKGSLKRNFWRMIIVCFIMMIAAGAYGDINTSLGEQPSSTAPRVTTNSNSDIVVEFLDNVEDEEEGENPLVSMFNERVSGETKGALGSIFNNTTKSGSFIFGVLNSINHLTGDKVVSGVVVTIGLLISVVYWLFVSNLLRIGECRFFLETRCYVQSEPTRLLFLYKIRKVWNPAKVMLLRTVFLVLWFLTIVGGFIKTYSYMMVPYIVAENPEIEWREAFALSKKMMSGNKWRAFVLDLSFILWFLLNSFTFGLLGVFFLNPYRSATKAELYMALREEAIKHEIDYSGDFNDRYLVEVPAGATAYPVELFTIPEQERRKWINVDYDRHYSLINTVMLFFTFSMIGWCWEVGLNLIESGEFINRGTMFGPWLPIYGTGGILMVLLLRRFAKSPGLTFVLASAVCGIVEYATGWFLDTFLHMKWWDYTGYFLNINGYICLESVLVFGLGGLLFIYILAPSIDSLYNKIPKKVRIGICVVLLSLFCADAIHSSVSPNTGKGISS